MPAVTAKRSMKITKRKKRRKKRLRFHRSANPSLNRSWRNQNQSLHQLAAAAEVAEAGRRVNPLRKLRRKKHRKKLTRKKLPRKKPRSRRKKLLRKNPPKRQQGKRARRKKGAVAVK